MLSKVAEVLDVEGGQRQVVSQAASGNPGVILRPWSASPFRGRGELSPHHGDVISAMQDRKPLQPPGHPLPPQLAPLPPLRPLCQLALRDERDSWFATDQPGKQRRRERTPEAAGSDVGVQDNPAHRLGQIGPAGRIGVGQELLKLLIRLEDTVAGKIIS
jgi:hypothetical protein